MYCVFQCLESLQWVEQSIEGIYDKKSDRKRERERENS